MSGVFISHASHDELLVGDFVDTVIRLGCSVNPKSIFYSSGEDTGVPSGHDLLSDVRQRVGTASLVVAIISPAFQTRPVCIAELGAAWSRVNSLFPLALPGMKRTDLEGVLEGMAVRYLDDGAALDELHDRVGEALGSPSPASTWGRYKAKWLANVDRLVEMVPSVRVATVPELERLEGELEGARTALKGSENDLAELREQLDELSKVLPAETVRRVRLPKGDVERFGVLREEAIEALSAVPRVVREAVWYDLDHREMSWPNPYEDQERMNEAREALDDGFLIETSSGLLAPNRDFSAVDSAADAAAQLQMMLADPSENFEEWFRGEYGMPLDLRMRAVWDKLLK